MPFFSREAAVALRDIRRMTEECPGPDGMHHHQRAGQPAEGASERPGARQPGRRGGGRARHRSRRGVAESVGAVRKVRRAHPRSRRPEGPARPGRRCAATSSGSSRLTTPTTTARPRTPLASWRCCWSANRAPCPTGRTGPPRAAPPAATAERAGRRPGPVGCPVQQQAPPGRGPVQPGLPGLRRELRHDVVVDDAVGPEGVDTVRCQTRLLQHGQDVRVDRVQGLGGAVPCASPHPAEAPCRRLLLRGCLVLVGQRINCRSPVSLTRSRRCSGGPFSWSGAARPTRPEDRRRTPRPSPPRQCRSGLR